MNSANRNDRLVAEYLERLTRALQDLPRDRRDSIIEDIREHIRTARAGMASEDEAQIRQLLEDLDSPQSIRAEAGLPPHSRAGWGDILAPWLLLLGGFGRRPCHLSASPLRICSRAPWHVGASRHHHFSASSAQQSPHILGHAFVTVVTECVS